ncbi:MAG: histidine phosphatase family protein [Lentisphaeria bacterium]|nr:histidine phosphatase family protein [Lentisphaeria bacterium]
MEYTEFYFIRHGQTADNLKGILQGHRDTDLDEVGLRQAEALAERLRGIEVDGIFTSDLRRTSQTAAAIGKVLAQEPVPMKELREWHLGELEGKCWTELKEQYPEIVDCFNVEMDDIAVPGGESHEVFENRIFQCLEKLGREWCGKRIILVTHGGVMRAVFKHIVGPVAAGNILPISSNASYSNAVRYADGRWRLRCWNDVAHISNVCDSKVF